MDEKGKKHSNVRSVEEKRKVPASWELTEEDKAFLRSCNICPE